MDESTLVEEVLLLSLDARNGARHQQGRSDRALVGAALMELLLARRVDIKSSLVATRDPAPLGDPALDGLLARIAADPKPAHLRYWVSDPQVREVLKDALRALVDKGVLREQKGRLLGVYPVVRHPQKDGHARADLGKRLTRVLVEGAKPAPRTWALVALLHAAGLNRLLLRALPDTADRQAVERRVEQLSHELNASAAPSVRDALWAIQAAMIRRAAANATTITIALSAGS